jgi:hypothetical protein
MEEMNTLIIFKKTSVWKIYGHKSRRSLKNNQKQEKKKNDARDRYCKIYKIPPINMLWPC